jgi:hypothetical protein
MHAAMRFPKSARFPACFEDSLARCAQASVVRIVLGANPETLKCFFHCSLANGMRLSGRRHAFPGNPVV